MASTADEPEQTPDQAGEAPSVDPSVTPSTPRRQRSGVSAGQARRTGGRRRSDNPHVPRRPQHRRTSTGPRRRELLQALGIFQRATPDQLWKLTRPDNRHDKLVRDNLLDLEDHQLVRIELVREDQRQVWVLTRRGHGEAKQLLEPKGIRISALREEKYDRSPGSCSVPATTSTRRRSPRRPPNSTVPGSVTGSASRRRSGTGSRMGTCSGRIWWCGRRRPGCR